MYVFRSFRFDFQTLMAQPRNFECRTINKVEKQQGHLASHPLPLPPLNQVACSEQPPRSSLQLHPFLVPAQQEHLGRMPPNSLERPHLVGLVNRTNLQLVLVAAYLAVHLLSDNHNSNHNSHHLLSVGLVSKINNRTLVVVFLAEHSGRTSLLLDLVRGLEGQGQVSFVVIVTNSVN